MMIQRRWLQVFSRPWRDAHNTQQSTLGSCCKFYLWSDSATRYPLLNIGHRISNGQIENWDGCDAFSDFLSHIYSFYLATGETSESLIRLTRTTRHLFLNETGRNYTILSADRVMLYMMCWDPTHLIIILLLFSM